MNIRPLANHIAVKQIALEIISGGGILLGEEKGNTGEVLAVGPGKMKKGGGRDTMWGVKPGDRIVFSTNGNAKFKIEGEELVMIRRDAIIGIVQS